MPKRAKKAKAVTVKRVPLNSRIDSRVAARARGALVALAYEDKGMTMQDLVESALKAYLKTLERGGLKIKPLNSSVKVNTSTTTTKG